MLIEGVEHDLRVGVALAVDDDAHSVAARFVADVRNALDALVAHHVGDGLDELRLVDLIGDLRDDDAAPHVRARAHLLDLALGADDDAALTRPVRLADAAPAHDDAARGEIGRGDILHELVDGDLGVVDECNGAVDRLCKVMGRDVGRHTHGDAVRPVDEQIGEACGEHGGLHLVAVEVGEEVHRLLVEVSKHLGSELRKARLGVTHGGRAVAVHRAEVAVAVYEGEVDGEVLRKTHEGVVHRTVAVRVEFSQDVTDDAGALAVVLVVVEAHLVHRIEDAAVDGLEAVSYVRNGARFVDRHRIGNEGAFELIVHLDVEDLGHCQRFLKFFCELRARLFLCHKYLIHTNLLPPRSPRGKMFAQQKDFREYNHVREKGFPPLRDSICAS